MLDVAGYRWEGLVNCQGCGSANRDGAKFCIACGSTLALLCDNCGRELPAQARFCDSCGSSVAAEAAAEPVAAARKVVTVLFSDLTGSTALEERLDAEPVRALLDLIYATMRKDVEDRGGRVVKFTGDGLMAAFGVPEVAEDDAERAIDTAAAMCASIEALAQEMGEPALALKVGVNTGEVVVIEDDDDVVGDSVNVAARLEGAAQAGEVLVGETTWRLTRASASYEAVEPLVLKGKREPVAAYRLISIGEGREETGSAVFVGRDTELEQLVAAFEDVVASNSARLVTIVGSPGLGKTRLVQELGARLGDRAGVVETRCDAVSGTFAPVAEALRAAAGIEAAATTADVIAGIASLVPDDPDADRIATLAGAVLGAGTPGTTEETFWAIRRLLESAAAGRPVVLVLDDLHWAEPLLLDLVGQVAEWIRSAPVLVVGTGRPELREIRPSLVETGRVAAVIALEGLDGSSTEQLACDLLGTPDVPRDLLSKLPLSTEGNPLFVREFVRMLVDDGRLRRTDAGWTATVDIDAIDVPPTIQSLLAARVDRLGPAERGTLELASVVGREFYRGALGALASPSLRNELDASLESLRRKELVEPAGTYWIDEPVYRFHHALIRDAAYRRVLKETRADLHERVSDWLEDKTQGLVGEHEELIGYHLEQAHEYRRQLGRLDEHATAVGRRAGALLALAARRALDRDDLPAAAALSARAVERYPAADPDRAEALIVRCEAVLGMGDVAQGVPAVEELDAAAATARLMHWATCFTGQLANLTSPERLREMEKLVAAAAAELTELGDPAGAAKAHNVHAATLARLGRFADCEAVLDSAKAAATYANDHRRITAVLDALPAAALWGPNPVSRAGGRCLDVLRLLRITTGAPAVEATSQRCQAVLEAFRGRADAARKMLRSSRRTLEELGLRHGLLETAMFAGIVEIIAGDALAAEEHLRDAHDGFLAMGVDADAAQAAALLARACLMSGRTDEAEELADESERLGGQDLKTAIAWRSVRAQILARRGQFDEARRLAESAVDIAARTDALVDQGDAYHALAVVCEAAGDAAGARSASEHAAACYERKGATALLDRPREMGAGREEPAPADRTELVNAAVRAAARLGRHFARREWDAIAQINADNVVHEDRRRGLRDVRESDSTFADLPDVGVARIDGSVVAIRGDRLALTRAVFRGKGDDPTAFATETLILHELDESGRVARRVIFDGDDLVAATEELDRRFIEGEAAAYGDALRNAMAMFRALNHQEWDSLRAAVTPDFVLLDHSPASRGEQDLDGYIESLRTLVELADDFARFGSVFHAVNEAGLVGEVVNRGRTSDGVDFELTYQAVLVLRGGLCSRIELFPAAQRERAIARFDELVAGSGSKLENSASRAGARMVEPFARRDWNALAALYAPNLVGEDCRRGVSDRWSGVDAMISHTRALASVAVTMVPDTIAIRGDRLSLDRYVFRGRDPAAEFSAPVLVVTEVDDSRRIKAAITFDSDDIAAGLAELDDRFIAGEGQAVADTWQGLRALPGGMSARDWGRVRQGLAPDFAFVDHTLASRGELDGEAYVRSLKALSEVAARVDAYLTTIHHIEDGAAAVEAVNRGVTKEGAEFEIVYQLVACVRNRLLARVELFAADQVESARTRARDFASRARLENAATRRVRRSLECFDRRDWTTMTGLFAPDVRFEDRRSGMRNVTEGVDKVVDSIRAIESVSGRAEYRCLAIRGDRLALGRLTFHSMDPDNIFSAEVIALDEVDEHGRTIRGTTFDPGDLDAAFVELDERYAHGEGRAFAPSPLAGIWRLINTHDWAGLRDVLAPDVQLVDHRPASLGTVRGAEDVIEARRTLHELAPDIFGYVAEVHAHDADRAAIRVVFHGTSVDGAAIEMGLHIVWRFVRGRIALIDQFPEEALDAALARYDELGTPQGATLSNSATAMGERWTAAFARRDWDAIVPLCSEDLTLFDRRAGLGAEVRGRSKLLENVRNIADLGVSRFATTILAIRGQRLALSKRAVHDDARSADWEVEYLSLEELDENGLLKAFVTFDLDDRDAAFEELDDRFAAAEGADLPRELVSSGRQRVRAINERDWDAYRRWVADDLIQIDHRPASLGEVRGGDEHVAALRALAEIVPEYRVEIAAIHDVDPPILLCHFHSQGRTLDGDEIDVGFHGVYVFDGDRLVRMEMFGMDDLAAARARFAEIRAESRGSLDNGAARIAQRLFNDLVRGDFEAFAAHFASDCTSEDRRARLGVIHRGRAGMVEQGQAISSVGVDRIDARAVATRGDNLVLLRTVFRSKQADSFEVELLQMVEVYDGLIRAMVAFEVDDRDAAFEELDDRFAVGEGADFARAFPSTRPMGRAVNARDWDSYRRWIADDLVQIDHRPASLGEIRGGDQHVAAVRALAEVVPDYRVAIAAIHEAEAPIALCQFHAQGRTLDGGEVDLGFHGIYVFGGDRLVRMELFGIDDLAKARARFAELRAERVSSLSNAATRMAERSSAAFARRDWDEMAACCAEDLTTFDRRVGLVSEVRGRSQRIENLRTVADLGVEAFETTVLAIRGDRLALSKREVFYDAGSGWRVEYLSLEELDENGLLKAVLVFEVANIEAAFEELDERFITGEGRPHSHLIRLGAPWLKGINTRDWELLRSCLADDHVLIDHRPASLGEVRGVDDHVEAVKTLTEVVPGARFDVAAFHVLEDPVSLVQVRVQGEGDIDLSFHGIMRVEGDRMKEVEIFALDDLDSAQARFEEIRSNLTTRQI